MSSELWLIGCGRIFETIAASWEALEPGTRVVPVRLESTDAIAGAWESHLTGAPPDARCFVAVDQSALNFARFDAWARLRMIGRRLTTLVHPSAVVDPTAQVGENCWIGARAVIEPQAKLGADVFVGASALVGPKAEIGAHGWLGAGALVGADAVVGSHVVIGADVRIGAGVTIGRHSSIDVPGAYTSTLAERTYIDPLFELPVRIHSGRAAGGH